MDNTANTSVQDSFPQSESSPPPKPVTNLLFVIGGIIILFVIFGGYNLIKSSSKPPAKACTMEAKICPDGSSVSRTGPNCELAPCPQVLTSPTPTPNLINESSQSATASWKTYDSLCGFSIKYPPGWTTQKYFIQDSSDSCAYMTSSDYKSGLDTRSGFYVSISKTAIGSKFKTITINSLEDYIASKENISEPPSQVSNKLDKVYGSYQGKQFDLGLFEFQTEFIFIKDRYIYSVIWPSAYTGTNKNILDQILSTFKFL